MKTIKREDQKADKKKDQPKLEVNKNDFFPKEFEEHRSENIRMKPQLFTKREDNLRVVNGKLT